MSAAVSGKLFTVQQAASLLGIHPSTVRRWAQERILVGRKVSPRGNWRFTRHALRQVTTTPSVALAANKTRPIQTAKATRKQIEKALQALITERQQLVRLSQAKDEFISLASHELRTPATAVKQYVGMVLEGYAGRLTAEQKRFLTKAYESNERQLNTINDLLHIAQIDAGKMGFRKVRCDMIALITSVVQDRQNDIKGRRQKVVFHSKSNAQHVWVDKGQLRMVLDNLTDNASKYSPEHTTITITLRQDENYLVVSVADQGVGIAARDVGKLFQKFSRIPNPLSIIVGGNGLGLYIAYKIVSIHNGRIDVTSMVGKGSVFTLRLPLHIKRSL